MNSVQRPNAPQAQMLNRIPGQQLGSQISSAYQNSPMASAFNPIFDRIGSAMNEKFAPITSAIQGGQPQAQQMPSQPMASPVLGMSQPSQPMGQFPNAMRALWGRR